MLRLEEAEKSSEVKPVGKVDDKAESDAAIVEHKLTLSPSIIDPSLTAEQIKAMPQKDQLIMMMEHLKQTGKIDFIVKVGLFVADLGDFKPLNSEYVKYFGIKPPVRVCVEIPGDEVMAYFVIWEHSKSTIDQFRETQHNVHVQSISDWAAPNIGPYSQCNKMNNVLFLAGNIGLYPSLLKLIDADDVVMQYKQIKHNFNQIIKEATQQKDLIWQQVAKSAIVYVSAKTNVEALLPILKEEMAFLEHAAVLVRMPCLPMNCLIEIELLCDVTDPGSGDKTIGCIQNTI